MSEDKIKRLFSDMIGNFRTKEKKLNKIEKKQIDRWSSLSKPCQLYIISSFDHNHHLIIKTHFSILKDKQIRFVQLPQSDFATQLKRLINDFEWIKNTNQNKPHIDYYRSLVDSIIDFGRWINISIANSTTTIPHNVTYRGSIFDQIFIWRFAGKIEQQNFEEEFKLQPAARIVENSSGRRSGLLTSFFPPIFIGEVTSMVEDRILQNYGELAKNTYSTKINNILVVVLKGGLLGVQTDDLEMAKKIFNAIMATTLICGIPAHLVRKGEIAGIDFANDISKIRLRKIMHSSLRMDMITSSLPANNYRGYLRRQISLDDLKLIMNYCKNSWNKSKDQKYLDLIINGFTLLENENYSPAFLIFWTIIEIHLHSLWTDKLRNSGVTQTIQNNLDRWYLNTVLEILNVDKLISKNEYSDYKKLVVLRNSIIHAGNIVTKQQADECHNAASTIVKNQIRITNTVNCVRTIDY